MLKIGIVGVESSHTKAFEKIISSGDSARIVSIVETNDFKTIEGIDAVIITERDGNRHKDIAFHFIGKGIPLWIDKPFACKTSDADEMVKFAEKSGVILTGGSTIKFLPHIQNLKTVKNIKSAKISFVSDINNIFNGLHFYGSHLAETALEIFGRSFRLISVAQNEADVTALLQYDSFILEMCFLDKDYDFKVNIETKDEVISEKIDLSECYRYGIEYFFDVLKGKRMPEPTSNLIQNVKIMEEIVCTLNNG